MENQTISVRVPATVGNFGGAGDCATLALDASLNVKITRRADGRVSIRYFGENGERVPRDRSNLVVRAMGAALHLKQREFTGADLEIYSSVPVSVGLGSSTAAVLSGLIAANLLYRLGLDEKNLLGLASMYEGRRGNLRAAWLGGFATCVDASGLGEGQATRAPYVYQRMAVPENFLLNVVVPETSLVPGAGMAASGDRTSDAAKSNRPTRRASDRIPLLDSGNKTGSLGAQDGALHLNRAAVLAEFFAQSGNAQLIELDTTLPPTCEKNVAGLEAALKVRTPGLVAVFVCGSGPAVGVFAPENPAEAVRAVRQAFAQYGVASGCFEFRASNTGALDWTGARSETMTPPIGRLAASRRESEFLPV